MEVPIELDSNEGIKTLGLLWHPLSDQFLISKGTCVQKLREPKNSPISKRIISSIVAAIFDPLGLISPVVVVCKIFLQQLWLHKLDWDDQLPSELLNHWKRIVGKALLTFEGFSTLITQVEACLNSRPLTALFHEPNDPSHLSPGHFLIGAPLTPLPEPDFTNTIMNSLSRWQRVQQFNQQLWKRWSSDYLNNLQQRSKWRSQQPDLQPGMLVLL